MGSEGTTSAQVRSEGIDFLRLWFSLQVLLFGHIIFWASDTQGVNSVPVWLLDIGQALIWTFQRHGELNPAVLGFIVLSGYCIHRNGLGDGKPLKPFAVRRLFRIFPVFLLSTALGILLFLVSVRINSAAATTMTSTPGINLVCVAAKVTTVASLLPIAHPCSYAGNAPLLTVMVEIGLYTAYGIIFWVNRHWLVYLVSSASIMVGIAIAARNISDPLLYNWWQNSSLLAFFPYWWIGAAALSPQVRDSLIRWTPVLLLAWISLTCLSQLQTNAALAEVRKLVLALLMARMIVWVDGMAMPRNPFSWLGRASYSIYGLHAPIAVLAIVLGFPWWSAATMAIIGGALSFLVFERPLDKVGHKLAKSSYVLTKPTEAEETVQRAG